MPFRMSRACRTGTAIEEGPACAGGAFRPSEGRRWQLLRPPPYLLEATARPAQPWDWGVAARGPASIPGA